MSNREIAIKELNEMFLDLEDASCHEQGLTITCQISGYLNACKQFNIITESEAEALSLYANNKGDRNSRPKFLD